MKAFDPGHLRRIPIFADLTEDDLKKISSMAVERQYKKGQIIFFEGEPGEAIYFIKSGRVKISKSTPDGREQILHFVEAGDIFAEVVLFDSGPYPATAETMEDVQLGLIRNQDLENLLRVNPDIALKILRVMSKRLRQAQTLIKELALGDTYSRTVSMLLKLKSEFGEQTAKGVQIRFNLTHQELANLIGTSRETVTRILNELKKNKIIDVDRQRITIINEKKLKEYI